MRSKIRGLNPNETYCCTKEDVKAYFNNEDIDVYFGIFSFSRKEEENSRKYRINKKCNDIIIAKMVVHKRCINKLGSDSGSSLKFFILNKITYPQELRLKFVTEVLPKLKEIYEKHKDDDIKVNRGALSVTIGLNKEQFNFYESIYGKYRY